MARIRTVDTLELVTDIGKCQVQLCFGDITALPKEDEVDVLVISAFPGDYSPTPSSLIGQLLQRLGVNVRHLAQDKEEDLRRLYSCWWSKPLPDHLSFRKILCFEGSFKAGKLVSQVVGDVFRCLVPVLANKEGKVIMPILASGDQKYSKTKMLKLLVNAAVHWMKAGLPLRCLKIVIFSRDVTQFNKAGELLVALFQFLKETHEDKIEKQKFVAQEKLSSEEQFPLEYDVYLSYCEVDQKAARDVLAGLMKTKKDVRVFSTVQELDVEESWQEKLYVTMTECKRVVALITPSYLQSTRCTEQYNMALCLSRKAHDSILVPFYVSQVLYMPTYMKLTQYIDCRINFSENVVVACVTVVNGLSVTPLPATEDQDVNKEKSFSPENYDVFMSYSHCNQEQATQIIKELRQHQPDINIFIDTAKLKAGGAWQQTLYHALDCSKFVIALISNDYIRSKICLEELALSITNQLQDNCRVFPLVIEPLVDTIGWLNLVSPVNCSDGSSTLTAVCKDIATKLKEPPSRPVPSETKEIQLSSVLEEVRSLCFQDNFATLASDDAIYGVTRTVVATPLIGPKNSSSSPDIYIISSSEDFEYCRLLKRLLLSTDPALVIKISSQTEGSARVTFLDEARVIVSLLSSSFMESPELVHELNIAWCRQRYSSNLCFLAITVDQLPHKPTYVRLLPCFFNSDDKRWKEMKINQAQQPLPELSIQDVYASCNCQLTIVLCFFAAVDHLLKWFKGQKCTVFGLHDKFINYLYINGCIQRSKEMSSNVDQEKQQGNSPKTSRVPCLGQTPEVETTSLAESVQKDDLLKSSPPAVNSTTDAQELKPKLPEAEENESEKNDDVAETSVPREPANDNGAFFPSDSNDIQATKTKYIKARTHSCTCLIF